MKTKWNTLAHYSRDMLKKGKSVKINLRLFKCNYDNDTDTKNKTNIQKEKK